MIRENKTWSFAQVWNDSLERDKDRPLIPREKIWASELGGAMIDRYLKMTGVSLTNPPNSRSKRKFEAGNIWESIIGYVLSRSGLLQEKQTWLQYQYPGLLPVSGKLDFLAGGKPDYDKALSILNTEFKWLPEFISIATLNITTYLKEQFPDGLKNIILEIKSCSSYMFDKYEKKGEGNKNHKLQLFHYLKSKPMDEGHLTYVSKDDCRLLELGVLNPSSVEDDYKKDIEIITGYINAKQVPPKELPIVYEDGEFSANWKVGYSGYLTYLYELKNQKEFDDIYKPIAERFNRVLGRLREGKDMTDNNKSALEEMRVMGFDVDNIIEEIKKETDGGPVKSK